MSPYDEFMNEAIAQARKGMSEGGIPIGSVLIGNGKMLGKGHNRRVQHGDPTAHGEIDCLRNAGRQKSYKDTVIYSTLMPCHMCAGAIVQFGIPKVIAGEDRTFPSARKFMEEHGVEVIDLNLDECYELLQEFKTLYPQVWNEDIGVD
jgi:creatinine deaminase